MKYCTRCGHELNESDSFCRKCGHRQRTSGEQSDSSEEKTEETQTTPETKWTFAKAIKNGFRNTFVFAGTASRGEFWFFILFWAICSAVFMIAGLIYTEISNISNPDSYSVNYKNYTIAALAFQTFFNFILIGLKVRRMHDTGLPGWIAVIPIFWIIQAFKPSKKENNPFAVEYDINPRITRLGKIIFVLYTLGSLAVNVKKANNTDYSDYRPQLPDFNTEQLQSDPDGYNRT